ncbi:hypothetical protein OTU49_012248, partial [Cherax quadricarinatus]
MASGLLSLKWNNHRSTFFHILSTIRNKVILDEPGVKEEPQEVDEEVTETKDIIESQFSFDPLTEGDSHKDPGGGSSGPQGFDPQMLTSQPQSMEDLVAQAIPGSSGLQG